MSNYNSLKTTIDANIKQNGRQEITGQILNSVLNQMVTTLGAGYQFAGVATLDPATDPGTPDAKVFYIANGKGTYTNFGGLEVTEDDVVVLYWDTAWHKVSTGIASQAKLSELQKISGDAAVMLREKEFYQSTIPQSYISYSTKQPAKDSSSKRTDFIPVNDYDKVIGVGGYYKSGYVIAFYDSDYNLIENGSIRGRSTRQNELERAFMYDIPQGASYVIMSQYDINSKVSRQKYLMLAKSGDTANYLYSILANSEEIKRLEGSIGETNINLNGLRVYDKSILKPTINGYLTSKGLFSTDSGARRTDYIPIKFGDKIDYLMNMGNGGVAVGFFDSSKTLLVGDGHQTIMGDNTSPRKEGSLVVNDESASYVMFSSYGSFSIMYYKILMVDSKYEDIYNKIENLPIPVIDDSDLLEKVGENPLSQIKTIPGFASLFKDWGFIGDSMSSATFNTRSGGSSQYDYSWPQYLCRLCGVNGYNFTIPGITTKTWLASSSERGWSGCSVSPKKSYIIALGCNDADTSAPYYLPVGDIATDVDFEDFRNNNGNTFAGNYAGIIQRVKSISPQAKIFCVTLPQGDRPLANNYNAIIRSLVDKFDNVFLIDLWTYAKPVNGVWAQKYREGYHLNTVGYLYTAYEMMTYIDWHVRRNPLAFRDVGLIGTNQQMSGQYKISGAITNGENAFISIVNESVKAYTTSDNSGNYAYYWLPAGTYNIYVQKDGRTIYRDSITITNDDIQKNITL